jgi:hypothetical protein
MSPDFMDELALRDYIDVLVGLFELGLKRRPEETLREFSRRVSHYIDAPEFGELSGIVEITRYSGVSLNDSARERAAMLSSTVTGKLKQRRATKIS